MTDSHGHDRAQDHAHDHDHSPTHPTTAQEWDARYAGSDQIWSGAPNGTLVLEASGLTPGTALDVGCGEGGDAVWLATRGWRVTGVDLSAVALERAGRAAQAAGVEVTLRQADLLDPALDLGAFDLVTAHYASLPRTPDEAAAHALVRAVAPGGTLLVVGHDLSHRHEDGPEEAAFWDSRVEPSDVLALLDDAWAVQLHETRERPNAPEGSRHSHDVVLRAVRTR
jgi:SAM-dependent methyltransferase